MYNGKAILIRVEVFSRRVTFRGRVVGYVGITVYGFVEFADVSIDFVGNTRVYFVLINFDKGFGEV